MAIKRKHLLLCFLLCATLGLSLVFGVGHTDLRAPKPQVRTESPHNLTSVSQANAALRHQSLPQTKQQLQWQLITALQNQYRQLLNAYQQSIRSLLTYQRFIYQSIKHTFRWLRELNVYLDFAPSKPH